MTAADRLVAHLVHADDAPLDECLLLVSAALHDPQAVEAGMAALDRLARGVGPGGLPSLIDHLFVREGFAADVDDYHSADNSFLDSVIRRRRGMPITLSALLIAVGGRVGVHLHGVGMPGHFLVGVDDDPDTFVDAFAGGAVLDTEGAADRFARVFGDRRRFEPGMLARTGTRGIVARVLNNLTRSYAERDPAMLDPLLDLRIRLPGPPDERRLLIRVAESRGRWGLAADLREELDPGDPAIVQLRSRLN